MRELRLVARQRQKLVGAASVEKNRLYKELVDAGVWLSLPVNEIHGQGACAMVKALLQYKPLHAMLGSIGGRAPAARS